MGIFASIELTCPECGKTWSWQTKSCGDYGSYTQDEVALETAVMLDGVVTRCCEGYEDEDPAGYMNNVETPPVHVPAYSAKGCGAVFTIRSPEAVTARRRFTIVLEKKEN